MKKKLIIIVPIIIAIVSVFLIFIFSDKEETENNYTMQIYELAQEAGYTGTYEDWLDSIKGKDGLPGEDGREIELIIENNVLKYRYVGENTWLDLFSLSNLNGKSAYDLAKESGYNGTLNEWLSSLIGNTGKSAYDLAKENGYKGSIDEWLISLKGDKGIEGLQGVAGASGASAYDIAVAGGYTGTLTQWIESLKGVNGLDGKSAYDLAKEKGYNNTLDEWLASLQGESGASAYEIYRKNFPTYTKTESEWISDLVNGNLSNYITHTVKYNLNGGSAPEGFLNEEVIEDLKCANLTVPTKDGYTFIGWYTGLEVNDGKVTNTYKIDKDYNLIARWKANADTKYTVNYNIQKLDGSYEVFKGEEKKAITEQIITINENNITGFTLKESVSSVISGDGNTVINVYYTRNTYEVQFLTIDGTTYENKYFLYEQDIEFPNTEKDQSEFLGWYLNGELFTETKMGLENISIVGYWDYYETEELVFEITADNKYQVVQYNGDETEVYIPLKHDGLEVTTIKSDAFKDKTNITKIVVPNSVTTMERNCFRGCNNLQELQLPYVGYKPNNSNYIGYLFGASYENQNSSYIPNTLKKVTIGRLNVNEEENLTTVGRYAFSDCSSIEEVIIESGTIIGEYAFNNCTNLKKVILPNVTIISDYAFANCTSLTSITLPESLINIKSNSFVNCSSLLRINSEIDGVLNFPTNLKEIGNNAFRDCYRINNISFNNNLTLIESNSFKGLSSITKLVIPNSVQTIKNAAFQGCTSITELEIPFVGESRTSVNCFGHIFGAYNYQVNSSYVPSSLRKVVITDAQIIPEHGMRDCTMLNEIELNEGILEIKQYAFYNCNSILEIVVPASVNTIGTNLFDHCSSLKKATIKGHIDTIKDYLFSECISLKSFNSEEEVLNLVGYKEVGKYAFYKTTSVVKVIFDQELEYIDEYAFNSCENIEELNIPEKVTTINRYAFKDMKNIKKAFIPNSVLIMGIGVFNNCSKLTEVKVPFIGATKESSEIIGYLFGSNAYNYNSTYVPTTLKKITINYMKNMKQYCFYDCAMLEEVIINEGLEVIENNAFANCTKLKSFSFLETIKTINNDAFYNCYSLEEVYLPQAITELKSNTFYNCKLLKRVNSSEDYVINLPNDITNLEKTVFYNCELIKSLNLPSKLTGIGTNCFYGMSALTELVIPDSVITIDVNILYKADSLVKVKVPFLGPNINETQTIGYLFGSTNVEYHSSYVPKTLKEVVVNGGDAIEGQFSYVSSIEKVRLPNSITSITNNMFYHCTSLIDVNIPDKVTSVGDSAFYNCSSLESITLPTTITEIKASAFANCTKLVNINNGQINSTNKITLGENINTLGAWAFSSCSSITEVEIKGNIAVLEIYTFSNCSKLYIFGGENNVLVIPSSITQIKNYAFNNCKLFTSINVGEGISIESNAFNNCSFIY